MTSQTAITILKNLEQSLDDYCELNDEGKEVFRMAVDALEQSKEKRKKGKWIEFPNHMAYKCSECGRIIQTTDGRRNVSKHYPFCHCGADMRGKEE